MQVLLSPSEGRIAIETHNLHTKSKTVCIVKKRRGRVLHEPELINPIKHVNRYFIHTDLLQTHTVMAVICFVDKYYDSSTNGNKNKPGIKLQLRKSLRLF